MERNLPVSPFITNCTYPASPNPDTSCLTLTRYHSHQFAQENTPHKSNQLFPSPSISVHLHIVHKKSLHLSSKSPPPFPAMTSLTPVFTPVHFSSYPLIPHHLIIRHVVDTQQTPGSAHTNKEDPHHTPAARDIDRPRMHPAIQ